MTDVAIIGVGMHPFGRFPGKSAIDMAAEADAVWRLAMRACSGATCSSHSAGATRSTIPTPS